MMCLFQDGTELLDAGGSFLMMDQGIKTNRFLAKRTVGVFFKRRMFGMFKDGVTGEGFFIRTWDVNFVKF